MVCQELQELGAQDIKPGYKAVSFKADLKKAYELHLRLTTTSRLLRIIRECSGRNLAIITDQSARVNWRQFWPDSGSYLVEAVLGDREHNWTSNDISKAVRLGIEKAFMRQDLAKPQVDLKAPTLKVVAFLRQGRLTLSLDSTGKTMHKRGYRQAGHPAPIKETLAATCLRLMHYTGDQVFYDPMAGSGTIAIEAAYRSLNKAPLIHRKRGEFAFENWRDFDRQLWREVQDEVRKLRREEPAAPIILSDVHPPYLDMARQNARKARVEKHLEIRHGSFFELPPPAPRGLLLTNLPYGERLKEESSTDMVAFMKQLGDHLKQHYQGWTVGLLAAEQSPHKLIGLRPDRKVALRNGSIPCKLLIFKIYAGSRKQSKARNT